MAAPVWPSYARIQSGGIEVTAAPTVTRTEFDDGAVRQARRGLRSITQRTVTAEIAGARLVEFRAWAETHAHAWFRARDLDGAWRDVRVVGGVGGITYRQVARRAGPAWWEASMVLEDAPPAFLFPVSRVEWVALMGQNTSVVLPSALGGTAPITHSLPRIPAACTYDPATRTLTSPAAVRGRINAVAAALYPWLATDADGRTARMDLAMARSYVSPMDITRTDADTVRLHNGARNLNLPRPWFTAPNTTRYLLSLAIRRSGRITMDLGPAGPTNELTAAAERDLRLRVNQGDDVLIIAGPASPEAIARDTSEPYDWTLPAAPVAAWIDSLTLEVGAPSMEVRVHGWLWLPP